MENFKLPIVDTNKIVEIEPGVWVIPDSNHTPLLPNIVIIVGEKATLIIDTGLGKDNAIAVINKARQLSGGRALFLTLTHCHPEHGFGSNVVANEVTLVYNQSQWNELLEKGETLLKMFKKMIPPIAGMLDGVAFIKPNILYNGSMELELGDVQVEMKEMGGGHSKGDQIIIVKKSKKILFTGDLIEEATFGILGDNDSNALNWLDRLIKIEEINPDIIIPGHGIYGGNKILKDYRSYFEHAKNRVHELRLNGELSEKEIVNLVSGEILEMFPNWNNKPWATKTVENLSWPARF